MYKRLDCTMPACQCVRPIMAAKDEHGESGCFCYGLFLWLRMNNFYMRQPGWLWCSNMSRRFAPAHCTVSQHGLEEALQHCHDAHACVSEFLSTCSGAPEDPLQRILYRGCTGAAQPVWALLNLRTAQSSMALQPLLTQCTAAGGCPCGCTVLLSTKLAASCAPSIACSGSADSLGARGSCIRRCLCIRLFFRTILSEWAVMS